MYKTGLMFLIKSFILFYENSDIKNEFFCTSQELRVSETWKTTVEVIFSLH